MDQLVETSLRAYPDANSRIEKFIGLIDELIFVVRDENAWLRQGLPASRSKQITRKVEMSDLLKVWVDEITSEKVSIRTNDHELRVKFEQRMDTLKVEMDENILRLRAAIEASRRRIETVMLAIREQFTVSSPYTSIGRNSTRAMTLGTNVRA